MRLLLNAINTRLLFMTFSKRRAGVATNLSKTLSTVRYTAKLREPLIVKQLSNFATRFYYKTTALKYTVMKLPAGKSPTKPPTGAGNAPAGLMFTFVPVAGATAAAAVTAVANGKAV